MKKTIMPATLALALAGGAWAAGTKDSTKALKREVAVGESLSIDLPCNPTTGYRWELRSIDRKIAVPDGEPEFQQDAAEPGKVGVGGRCVQKLKGVKRGKTKAVFVYRRPWDKGEPAKTFTAAVKVLPAKAP